MPKGGTVAGPNSEEVDFVGGTGVLDSLRFTMNKPTISKAKETTHETGKPMRNQSGVADLATTVGTAETVPPGKRSLQRGQNSGAGLGTMALQNGQDAEFITP